MNTDHWIAPVENGVPRHVIVHLTHASRPSWEVSRGTNLDRNSHLLKCRFDVFDLRFHAWPAKIYSKVEARVALHWEASLIEKGTGFVEI